MSDLAVEINGRFHDFRSNKPLFSFLINPFAVDVVSNGYPVLSPITKDTVAVELELLELQEDKGLKRLKRSSVSTIEFLEKCYRRKIPTNKRVC